MYLNLNLKDVPGSFTPSSNGVEIMIDVTGKIVTLEEKNIMEYFGR